MRGSFNQSGGSEERHREAEDNASRDELIRSQRRSTSTYDSIEPLLEAFHDHALGEEDDRRVREHVASCAHCAARLRRYAEIDSVVRQAPAPQVGPELRTLLYARIATEQRRRRRFAAIRGTLSRISLGPIDASPGSSWHGRNWSRGGRSSAAPSWIMGSAATAVVLLAILLFTTLMNLPQRKTIAVQHPTQTAQVINSLGDLPKFSDYRAAYYDESGRMRIVSASGSEIEGPSLPNPGLLLRDATSPYYDITVSPNGHFLAYGEGPTSLRDPNAPLPKAGPVALVNLMTGMAISVSITVNDLSWSPDSEALAAPDYETPTTLHIIYSSPTRWRSLAVTYAGAPAAVPLVAGWIDTSHIAVFYYTGVAASGNQATSATPTLSASPAPAQQSDPYHRRLGSLDAQTGIISDLADLPDPADIFLAPDGQQAFIAPNHDVHDAYLIDTRTGITRALPEISASFRGAFAPLNGGNFWSVHSAWQPGSGHVLALSLAITGDLSTQQPGVWLLDLDRDHATFILKNQYPLAWLPQSPGALLLCDPPRPDNDGNYPRGGGGVGRTISMLFPVSTTGMVRRISRDGMLAFLGLVRTA